MWLWDVQVDSVPRSVYEQVCWERDIAIKQLNEIGISLGEKIDDVKRIVHGKWISKLNIDHAAVEERVDCSICGSAFSSMSFLCYDYCPNCGSKMDLEDDD